MTLMRMGCSSSREMLFLKSASEANQLRVRKLCDKCLQSDVIRVELIGRACARGAQSLFQDHFSLTSLQALCGGFLESEDSHQARSVYSDAHSSAAANRSPCVYR